MKEYGGGHNLHLKGFGVALKKYFDINRLTLLKLARCSRHLVNTKEQESCTEVGHEHFLMDVLVCHKKIFRLRLFCFGKVIGWHQDTVTLQLANVFQMLIELMVLKRLN